jgi:hypothetical protein
MGYFYDLITTFDPSVNQEGKTYDSIPKDPPLHPSTWTNQTEKTKYPCSTKVLCHIYALQVLYMFVLYNANLHRTISVTTHMICEPNLPMCYWALLDHPQQVVVA